MQKKRLVVGISGASGAPVAVEVLRQLRQTGSVESHLVITKGGLLTLRQETGLSPEELAGLADVFYENDRIGAALASGSFATEGMLVVPCSMKTVAGIASGYSDNLLLRAADVTLKERRKLVLVARESPLSSIHLRNMYELSRMGAVIMPPVMTYYRQADSVQEMTRNFVQRLLEQFGMKQEKWVREIGKRYPFPVVVSAGIHYDGIGREQIEEIMHVLDGVLNEICNNFSCRL